MDIRKRDYGDFLILLGMAGFAAWYLRDAMSVSLSVENLLLILPLSVLVLIIVAIELIKRIRCGTLLKRTETEGDPLRKSLPVVALFSVYVMSVSFIGFDVAGVLFIAAFLLLTGERNWLLLVGYSVTFGLAAAFFFARMLPYPMHMLLLSGL